MKNLLLTLIFLFVSIEVKSHPKGNDYKYIDVKDCLKYLDNGKVIYKKESPYETRELLIVETIFSYNQKIYIYEIYIQSSLFTIIPHQSCRVYNDHED